MAVLSLKIEGYREPPVFIGYGIISQVIIENTLGWLLS
jgi:hypothetical protein